MPALLFPLNTGAQEFYQQFLVLLVQEVLYVMTDRLHKSGIKMHATLLRHLCHAAETGRVTAALFNPAEQAPGTTNAAFLRQYIATLLSTQFPNVGQAQVVTFVTGLFDLSMDVAAYKQHLRDFLVALKEFSGDDDVQQLFDEESAATASAAAAEEASRRQAVPGILNPYEVDDMGEL